MKRQASSGDVESDLVSRDFGDRVRILREGAKMTLEQFAKISGVSRAMISKVERGERSPTIGVAKRIAHALGTPLSILMGDEGGGRTFALVAKNQRQVFRDAETGFERHLLSPIMAGSPVEVVLHRLPPHESTGALPPYAAGASKHVVAIRGEVTVGFGVEVVKLAEGDALYFEADVEHWFENKSDQWSEYYLVIWAATTNRVT